MIVITGRDKRAEVINKLRKERIVITKGDRVIYLYPTDRVFGDGYGEVVTAYDVVFVNKAKGVKINQMSFRYCLGSHSVNGYVSDLYVYIGLEFWGKDGEVLNTTLKSYTDTQLKAFYDFIETSILEELEIK